MKDRDKLQELCDQIFNHPVQITENGLYLSAKFENDQLISLSFASNELRFEPYEEEDVITQLFPGMFDKFVHLRDLDLSDCFLDHLPAKLFDNLSQLTFLSLEINQFKTIPDDILNKLENLEIILLGNNEISSLPKNFFENNKKLKWIELCFNNITTLPNGIFDPIDPQAELVLFGNPLDQATIDYCQSLDLNIQL